MSAFLGAFRSKRVGLMVPLGFASGLPNPIVGTTLTAWMASEGVSLRTIGIFALVAIPYNFKFVWAPLLDRYRLPWLGRRRGWMVLSQILLLALIAAMGGLSPSKAPLAIATLALVVAFVSASQDIATDAYRTDLLQPIERASGTAVFVAGYRVAMIAAGAGALILSDHLPWRTVYAIMAGLMVVGIGATLVAPSPAEQAAEPKSIGEAVFKPLVEFFRRKGAATAVTIVMLYKVGDAFAGHLLIPFLMDLGFSRSEIGTVVKGLGMGATILGALVGGGLVARWGLRLSLLLFGILQVGGHLLYATLAATGTNHALLFVSIGVDNLCGGLGTAAFVAYLMSLCNKRFTAFQYALLSSASTVPGRLLAIGSGWLADTAGWPAFFVSTILIAAPALALLAIRRDLPSAPAEPASS